MAKRGAKAEPTPAPTKEKSDMPALTIEHVALDALHLDPANARKHPERNLRAIKASLVRFGQQKPIVIDANNIVRAGNGTLEAALSLGWTTVACVRTALVGVEAVGYALADNRTGELAEWDTETLAALLKQVRVDGADIQSLGWEDFELEPMLAANWEPPPVSELPTHAKAADTHAIIFTAEEWAEFTEALECERVAGETPDLTAASCVLAWARRNAHE